MSFEYKGTTYSFPNAPKFVLHQIKLITDKWGTNLTGAQGYVQHQALDLGKRFGTVA